MKLRSKSFESARKLTEWVNGWGIKPLSVCQDSESFFTLFYWLPSLYEDLKEADTMKWRVSFTKKELSEANGDLDILEPIVWEYNYVAARFLNGELLSESVLWFLTTIYDAIVEAYKKADLALPDNLKTVKE